MKSTKSANPLHNLTEMMHDIVLGEQTGMKTELFQTNVKSQGFIYRASFQRRLHWLMHVYIIIVRD